MQQRTVGAVTHALYAIIREVQCSVEMDQYEDRNIDQAEGGFFSS